MLVMLHQRSAGSWFCEPNPRSRCLHCCQAITVKATRVPSGDILGMTIVIRVRLQAVLPFPSCPPTPESSPGSRPTCCAPAYKPASPSRRRHGVHSMHKRLQPWEPVHLSPQACRDQREQQKDCYYLAIHKQCVRSEDIRASSPAKQFLGSPDLSDCTIISDDCRRRWSQ